METTFIEKEYLKNIYQQFITDQNDRKLFEQIIQLPADDKNAIRENLSELAKRQGLAFALLALFRQQVHCGFVLDDPLVQGDKEEKKIYDDTFDIEFQIQWNPGRSLRKNHDNLIKRGVISGNVDEDKLVNKGIEGKPCYLCEQNISLQNPSEIVFPTILAGGKYIFGANFAYISNNHFTLMSLQHRNQRYSRQILNVLSDFLYQTNGCFRIIFNGLAGTSIPWHEHFQITTEPFPIESIRIQKQDIITKNETIMICNPDYYIPLWIVEGQRNQSAPTLEASHQIILNWHKLNAEYHTENIVACLSEQKIRVFIFLRDQRRLIGTGKDENMGAFECGGKIVLSNNPPADKIPYLNERKTFQNASISTVRTMLSSISPEMSRSSFRDFYRAHA